MFPLRYDGSVVIVEPIVHGIVQITIRTWEFGQFPYDINVAILMMSNWPVTGNQAPQVNRKYVTR
jgi:hypothetical protein